MKRQLDERQMIVDDKCIIRTFAFFFVSIIIFIIFLGVVSLKSAEIQLSLIGIICLTFVYMTIDSFLVKTLYTDISDKKDIYIKIKVAALSLGSFNLFVWILSYFNKIQIDISIKNILILALISSVVLSFYYFILKIWLFWYNK
ncbi:hypothetical protein MTR10_10590 [Staphylococcus agnetis]|uniref:hypothetical protein n=1 Tax=Staphylococcus agnetis TaxID=985762 RepID=UPI00208E4868|nr:hypothetical protein [Staphylococcus agnetis]MCO4351503.1 hypothetical protein [Staphylococcus agnetis]MCO4360917.1 hypothetical protein [Staphylococcus agnetis]MCO4372518.1 hypothetical protein [Staphylococcus agnetis]